MLWDSEFILLEKLVPNEAIRSLKIIELGAGLGLVTVCLRKLEVDKVQIAARNDFSIESAHELFTESTL